MLRPRSRAFPECGESDHMECYAHPIDQLSSLSMWSIVFRAELDPEAQRLRRPPLVQRGLHSSRVERSYYGSICHSLHEGLSVCLMMDGSTLTPLCIWRGLVYLPTGELHCVLKIANVYRKCSPWHMDSWTIPEEGCNLLSIECSRHEHHPVQYLAMKTQAWSRITASQAAAEGEI